MTSLQAEAARRRWENTPPDERVRRTSAAVTAAGERRRTAFALLRAIEASGMRIEIEDDAEVTS